MTDTKPQIQEVEQTPSRINTKTLHTEYHIQIAEIKNKEKKIQRTQRKSTLPIEEQSKNHKKYYNSPNMK